MEGGEGGVRGDAVAVGDGQFCLAGDGEGGGEQGILVHLDDDGVIADGGEGEVTDIVDQVDALKGTLRFKFAIQENIH